MAALILLMILATSALFAATNGATPWECVDVGSGVSALPATMTYARWMVKPRRYVIRTKCSLQGVIYLKNPPGFHHLEIYMAFDGHPMKHSFHISQQRASNGYGGAADIFNNGATYYLYVDRVNRRRGTVKHRLLISIKSNRIRVTNNSKRVVSYSQRKPFWHFNNYQFHHTFIGMNRLVNFYNPIKHFAGIGLCKVCFRFMLTDSSVLLI